MKRGKVLELREITRLHDIWLKKSLFGRESVSPEELAALEAYGKLPMDIDMSKSLALVDPAFAEDLLRKADVGNPMKQPAGPASAQSSTPSGSPNLSGAGGGRPSTGGGIDRSNLTPVSKKDHPQQPEGTVDQSEHTWYVKPGAPQAKVSEEEVERKTTAREQAKKYGKIEQPHAVALAHLSEGNIVEIKRLGEGESGATESHRILIEGNGHGLMKPRISMVDTMYEVNYPKIVSGGDTVPPGTHPLREKVSYTSSMAHGLTQHVPPTTTRAHDGQTMSVQKWIPGLAPGYQAVEDRVGDEVSNYTNTALNMAPAKARDHVEQKLMETVVLDIIQNNNDRHFDNIIWKDDFSDFRLIDGGFSHGNGMDGIKSAVHSDFHNVGKKVKIPEKLQTRMKNMSLGDYKKSMKGMKSWEQSQSFLRNRYSLHLQETEGHLDFEKFRPTISNISGGEKQGHPGFWEHLPEDEFEHRQKNGLLSNQLFEGWAKAYIDKASSDPNHPDYHDALEMKDKGVFMGPGHTADPEKYRAEGRHVAYEASITPRFDLPTKIRRDTVADPGLGKVSADDSDTHLVGYQAKVEAEKKRKQAATPVTEVEDIEGAKTVVKT